MRNLRLESVSRLEVVEYRPAPPQVLLRRLGHEAQLGVKVGFLFLVLEGMPRLVGKMVG